jgi:segregation and condensation protein B
MSDEVKIPLPQSLQEIIGSLLFASEVPLTANDLRDSVRAVEAEEGENKEVMDVYRTCTAKEIAEALRGLEKALEVAGCGFRLVCTGGAYRLQSVPSCGRYVRAMLKMDRPSRLGRASLETLAIIAYRQPLTKSEIEAIRGVDVSGNVKTLMDLQLIRLVGKSELPGHPFLYGTTPLFLEHFGLASLQQLNELDPTLQRSNPKAKAASYKKPVEEKKAETQSETAVSNAENGENAESAEKENGAEAEGSAAAASAAAEDVEVDVGVIDEIETASEPVVLAEATGDDDDLLAGEASEVASGSEVSSDDDVVIDDTPDEFDDDDDDEEEGETEEGEENDDDEE